MMGDTIIGGRESDIPFFKNPQILRDQILYQLRKVIDPDLYKDIVSCGFVKQLRFNYDSGTVSFTLDLTTPACPVKDQFVDQCKSLLNELDWVKTVEIEVTATRTTSSFAGDAAEHLKGVGFILAVYSGKGGVGKSSIAVNLGYMLKNLGAKVGIVDVDVYGPSLHTLIPVENPQVFFKPAVPSADEDVNDQLSTGKGCITPCEYDGVKLMSYSYFRPEASAYAGVRGPLASSLAYQMVTQTDWGKLDYLIIDMPPGTGDVHLTVAQAVKITGALVITTPQQLSLVDVEKGIHFFSKLKIPIVAIIENMAYLHCPKCGTKMPMFQSIFDIDVAHECLGTFGREESSRDPSSTGDDTTTRSGTANKGGCCHDIEASVCECRSGTVGSSTMEPSCDESVLPLRVDSVAVELQGPRTPPSGVAIQRLISQFGVGVFDQLPLDSALSGIRFRRRDPVTGEAKVLFPFANAFDDNSSPVWKHFRDIARRIARELSSVTFGGDLAPEISTSQDGLLQIAITKGDAVELYCIPLRDVRLGCRCAQCIDEFTGKQILRARTVPIDVHPLRMEQANNYALRIEWSDGHSSLMAFTLLTQLSERVKLAAPVTCLEGADELEW